MGTFGGRVTIGGTFRRCFPRTKTSFHVACRRCEHNRLRGEIIHIALLLSVLASVECIPFTPQDRESVLILVVAVVVASLPGAAFLHESYLLIHAGRLRQLSA